MAKKKAASIGTPATVELTRLGLSYELHPYAHDAASTAYGDEAAAALGVDPYRIFKTLVVTTGSTLAVAVLPVGRQLDLKAVATALSTKKVALADPQVAARSSGYVVGGISPIGQRTPLPTLLDRSAEQFTTIYLSAGRRGLQVELSPQDLLAACGSLARIAVIAS